MSDNESNEKDHDDKDVDLLSSLLQENKISDVKEETENKNIIKNDLKISDLDLLKTTLEIKSFQKGLLQLYANSQIEHTRNNKIGMEIGMSREKDLISSLKYFLPDNIISDIDNTLPEDFLLNSLKISIKHSQGNIGSTVKAKWTSADKPVEDAIKSMIEAPDNYYPHLLIIYLEIKKQNITIICITSEQNKNTIKSLKEKAFTIPKGNSRGIEYSKEAMKILMNNKSFAIEIKNINITNGQNPIERRIDILKSIGIKP